MADPTNWLIAEGILLAVIGVITLFVTRAANRQNR
jgi:hypothetical protein